MICLNLPNNPTGTTLNHEEMQQLFKYVKNMISMFLLMKSIEDFTKKNL